MIYVIVYLTWMQMLAPPPFVYDAPGEAEFDQMVIEAGPPPTNDAQAERAVREWRARR